MTRLPKKRSAASSVWDVGDGRFAGDPNLRVRLFESDDAPELTRLLHAAYAELGAKGLNYTAVDQSVETTLARASAGRTWVVERDGRLVSTLTMSVPPSEPLQRMTAEARVSGRAWLNQVAVDPKMQGNGIAHALWMLGREWAAFQGAPAIGVDTAEESERLIAIYRSWGFEERDTVHWNGKTYDSVVMVCPLARTHEGRVMHKAQTPVVHEHHR